MSEYKKHVSALDESVDENFWGDMGVTGLAQKGLNAIGVAFKGTARESFAILLAYFKDANNGSAYQPLQVIGNALNSLIRRDKNKVSMDGDGEYAQNVGGAASDAAMDAAFARGTIRGGRKLAGKVASKGAGKVVGKAAGAIPVVGWAILGVDLINDAFDIVRACKNRKDPTFAPRKALVTLSNFFNTRGRKANTQEVQAALRSLQALVAQDRGMQNTAQRTVQTNTVNQQSSYTANAIPGYGNTGTQAAATQYTQYNGGYNTSNITNRQDNHGYWNRMVAENTHHNTKTVVTLTESELREIVAEAAMEVINEGVGKLLAKGVKYAGKGMSKGRKSVKNLAKKGGLKQGGKNMPKQAGGTISKGGNVSWNDVANGGRWTSTSTSASKTFNTTTPGNVLPASETATGGGATAGGMSGQLGDLAKKAAKAYRTFGRGKAFAKGAAVGAGAMWANDRLRNSGGTMGGANAQSNGNGYGYTNQDTAAGAAQNRPAGIKDNNSPDWQDWYGDPAENFQKYINSIQKF